MSQSKLRMIDADIHLYEPVEVWNYVDKEFRDRIKINQMIEDPGWRDGVYDVHLDGLPIPNWVLGDRESRFKRVYDTLKERFPAGAGWNAQQYMKDMKVMGFDQVVIYPTLFLWAPWIPQLGAKFSAALARAYNDWIIDFCANDPKLLKPIACLALHDVEEAINEAKRISKKGFVGVFIRPNPIYDRPVGHPDYHRLYKVLEELQLPLGIHEGGMTYVPILGADRTRAQWGVHAMSHAFEQMAAMISMLEHGVLDLCPKLNVLYLEAGSSLWVPYWLDRLDEEMELPYRIKNTLKLKPSEYFARQCWATFEAEDHYVKQAVECIGAKTLMMTSDYPHPETSYDETEANMREKGLDDEALNRVCWQNALEAYPRLK